MRLHALVADLETARRAVEGGATAVQLRLKDADYEAALELAERVRTLCRAGDVAFVVNDDVRLALDAEADYVHLGQEDLRLQDPPPLPFGLSAASVDEAVHAVDLGASYVGVGPIWDTPSKPDASPAIGLDGLRAIRAAAAGFLVAIGGVNAANVTEVLRAGADGVAVIRAVAEIEALRAAIDAGL